MSYHGDAGHTGLGEVTIPDGVEPVRGYRKWHMLGQHLTGTSYHQIWTEGVNRANCYRTTFDKASRMDQKTVYYLSEDQAGVGIGGYLLIAEDGELVPRPGFTYAPCPGIARDDHGCGFYARQGAKLEYEPGDKAGAYTRRVSGVVDMWGQVELGPEGVRAQYAKIVALTEYTLPERTQEQIDQKEDVLDTLDPRSERYEDLCLELARLYSPSFQWDEVILNYPNVPTFATEAEMLEAYPVPDLRYLYE